MANFHHPSSTAVDYDKAAYVLISTQLSTESSDFLDGGIQISTNKMPMISHS